MRSVNEDDNCLSSSASEPEALCEAPPAESITRYEYTDNRVPSTMEHNNQTYHLLYNHQGSLRAVVDTNGTIVKELQYDSFGNITLDTNPTLYPKGTSSLPQGAVSFGFAGGLYDEDTKLTRFGYRDYQAETGKWTAKDPIGFAGGDTNLYGYVLGDPVNFVDPFGLYFWELLTPTEFGPNEGIFIDKDGKKWNYNFETGERTEYWKSKKTYCETGKNDFEDSQNAKKNDLDKFMKDHRLKNPNKKPLFDLLDFLWGMF
jgi:RHS repeat-associated protein